MNQNELIEKIVKASITPATNIVPSELAAALMAVVELHKPQSVPYGDYCDHCTASLYPCETVRLIKEIFE